jgi:hypothetical protein
MALPGQTKSLLKSKASRIVVGVLALAIVWICFQLGTHRHTGILRAMAKAKHFLQDASSPNMQQHRESTPPGPPHSVSLSWKASTSAVVGYNVYRRGMTGVIKINSEPITGTSYVDSAVQPGQTYYYVTKAIAANGRESSASNEVQATIPSP